MHVLITNFKKTHYYVLEKKNLYSFAEYYKILSKKSLIMSKLYQIIKYLF